MFGDYESTTDNPDDDQRLQMRAWKQPSVKEQRPERYGGSGDNRAQRHVAGEVNDERPENQRRQHGIRSERQINTHAGSYAFAASESEKDGEYVAGDCGDCCTANP